MKGAATDYTLCVFDGDDRLRLSAGDEQKSTV